MIEKDDEIRFETGDHHARYFEEGIAFHVISRTFQGRMLLRPGPELNDIIAGVIAKAQELFPSVALYVIVFMSNHFHAMLGGKMDEIPAFIGFIKREISRRWGAVIGWRGTMWQKYTATALPTEQSQLDCLRYILAQGVKENLVARPQDWPGVHSVGALMLGQPLTGSWFDATRYARAVQLENRKRAPMKIEKADYRTSLSVTFHPIPALQELDIETQQASVSRMVKDIVEEAARNREQCGKRPMGSARVMKIPLSQKSELPPLPGFEARRRMIVWADRRQPEVKAYLDRYWAFQLAFRAASRRFRAGDNNAPFPPNAFRPSSFAANSHTWSPSAAH